MEGLLNIKPNAFSERLYNASGTINTSSDMPRICMTVRAADFIAFSYLPAPYFFGISDEGVNYEYTRLKKKMSAIVRQMQVGERKEKIIFYDVPESAYFVSGVELSTDAVEGIQVKKTDFFPQEVVEKICSFNSWERYDGLIYVKPEALQASICKIAKTRVGLLQGHWIRSRIWYQAGVVL